MSNSSTGTRFSASSRAGSRGESLRYELKLVCQQSAYQRVRMALRLHCSGVRELYPARRVQSIYFDTLGNRALEQNLAGISQREKLRFRWYGESTDRAVGTLERKLRENTLGWKESLRLRSPLDLEGQRGRTFVQQLARSATDEWRERLLHGLQPAQWIGYTREYLITADRRVRVTLDRDLRCADQRLRMHLSFRFPTPTARILVLEAKCAPEHYEAARALIGELPLVVDRCSKFVFASDPFHGPVASLLPD